MTDPSTDEAGASDERPRVTGWFDSLSPAETALHVAIARPIIGAAALEMALRLEVSRLLVARSREAHAAGEQGDDAALTKQLNALDRLTAGGLLTELRKFGLPADLEERIQAAVDRRNELVHRPFEDPEFARAVAGEQDVGRAVARFERLALDCGELAVELEQFAFPKMLELSGMSLEQVISLIQGLDPAEVSDPRSRTQLEAIQLFSQFADPAEIFGALGLPDKGRGQHGSR